MAALSSLFFLSGSSFSFFIFFLYFSMHACNSSSRSLGINNAGSLKECLDCKVCILFLNFYCVHESLLNSINELILFVNFFSDAKIGEKINLSEGSSRQAANAIGQQHDIPATRISDQFDAIFVLKAKEEEEDARTKSGVAPSNSVTESVSTSSWHKINHDKFLDYFITRLFLI